MPFLLTIYVTPCPQVFPSFYALLFLPTPLTRLLYPSLPCPLPRDDRGYILCIRFPKKSIVANSFESFFYFLFLFFYILADYAPRLDPSGIGNSWFITFYYFLVCRLFTPPPPLLLTAFYHSEYLCPSIYGIQCEGIRWLVLGFFLFSYVAGLAGWYGRAGMVWLVYLPGWPAVG